VSGRRAAAWATLSALGCLVAAAPAAAETVAITGATVHTMGPAGTLERATVLIVDGTIRAVGRDVAVPAGARRIDAAGRIVTPGLIDSQSRLGLVEVSLEEAGRDTAERDPRISAAFDVTDALNPRSTLVPIARVEGLTAAMAAPVEGGSPIAGQGALVRLGRPEGFVLRPHAALFVTLGEAGAALAGGSRAGVLLRLKEALEDALDYARNRAAFDRGDRHPYALSRLDLEALVPVARGERPLVATVNRASDIEAALRLAHDYNLRLVLAGAAEGWRVARQIAAAKVPVLVRVLDNLPAHFESLGATLENAARLHAAGVTVAFMSHDAHESRNLRQEAGNAVAYGLPWEAGLAAMTINPARIWGVAEHLGSLEPGKDADLVVWDGDPLELTSYPTHVFIRGAEMPLETRQTKLRDRYRDLNGKVPPAYRE
jgi:imidazolonepropionase-like amidohydrolase